jgi:hypothetical protein
MEDPQNVLGPPDWPYHFSPYWQTGTGGWIIIEFTDFVAYDGQGFDLTVYRWAENHDTASVYVSADAVSWEFIGTAQKDPGFPWPGGYTDFDFGHDVGLVRYVKLVDDCLEGGVSGYMVDAFEVLNGRVVPEPGLTALWFGVPAIGLGARSRRRQALASGPRRTPTTR